MAGDDRKIADDPGRSPVREWIVVGGLVVLAATVRLLFLSRWAELPLFQLPVGDERIFHRTALSLIGQGEPLGPFFFQPLYSFFLAAIYRLGGVDIALVRHLQLFIGVGNCLLCYALGNAMGGRALGIASGVVMALYGPMIAFEGMLLAPALTVPLTLASLWFLLRAKQRQEVFWVAPAGGCLGLALMGRPELILILPAGAVWLLCQPWRPGQRVQLVAMGLGALLLGISPSWIVNVRLGQPAIPISSQGGMVFFLGNNPEADGTFHVPRSLRWSGHDVFAYQRDAEKIAEAAIGHRPSPGEVSRYWFGQGLAFWRQDPQAALKLAWHKALLSISGEEIPVHLPYAFLRAEIPLLGLCLSFSALFPLALVGLLRGRKRVIFAEALSVAAACYLGSLIAFYVVDRFRLSLLPMLVPLAGVGLVELGREIAAVGRAGGDRSRSLRDLALSLLVLVVGFVSTRLVLSPDPIQKHYLCFGYNRMGAVALSLGRLEEAERYIRKSLEASAPVPDVEALNTQGALHERRGQDERAGESYRQAAALDPTLREARVNLARLAERKDRAQEAIDWWREVARISADPTQANAEIQRLTNRPQPQPAPPEAKDAR